MSTQVFAESQDFIRSTGKIYAVVGVLLLIFIGITIYMIRLDKRLKEVEDKINK